MTDFNLQSRRRRVIYLVPTVDTLATGDGEDQKIVIDDGGAVVGVVAGLADNGSANSTDIQVARIRAGVSADILNAVLAVEFDGAHFEESLDVDVAANKLVQGDILSLDIDALATGAAGLVVAVIIQQTRGQ